MNKKFSTLVAGMLLATTVGTSYAQGPAQLGTISAAPGTYVAAIENGKFYQLTNGSQVLIMDKTAQGTYILKFVNYKTAELAKSLWEIKAIKNNNENGLAFQFVNLTTGLPISFDPKEVQELGSAPLQVTELSQGVNHWSWLRGTEGAALVQSTSVEAYFGKNNEYVMTLMNTPNGVAAVKYATKDVPSISGSLRFTAREASEVYLNDYDLNTMLQSRDIKEGLKLTFNNEPEGAEFANEFTARSYQAVAPLHNSLSIGNKDDKYAEMKAAAEAMGVANTAYYKKLDELKAASSSLNGIFQELDKLEESVKGLDLKQGGLQVEENTAKQELVEADAALAAIKQQVADLPTDEDLQNQIAKAGEKLGRVKAELKALQNEEKALKNAMEDAKAAAQKAYSDWFNDQTEEKKNAYLNANDAYQTANRAYQNFDQNKLVVAKQKVKDAKEALNGILAQAAAGSELKKQLDDAVALYNSKEEALDAIQAEQAALTTQLVDYQLKKAEVEKQFAAAKDDAEVLYAEYVKVATAKDAANKAYFVAVDAYVAVQYDADNWYSLKSGDKYLMVDTAYMESYTAGVKHQKFAMKNRKEFAPINGNIWNARDINGRFNYRFKYFPTVDSLVITADGGNEKWETVKYWKDRQDYQINFVWGNNFVKLANLSNKHQEVTLGAPETVLGVWTRTLNTRIGLNLVSANPDANRIPAGVYFADIVKDKDNLEPISRLMLDLKNEFTKVATAEWNVMKFEDMPAAKWVVSENTIYNGSPAIVNQESTDLLNNGSYRILDVKKDGTVILSMYYYNYQGYRYGGTIKLTPVAELNTNGYVNKGFSANTDSLFTFEYLNAAGNVPVQIGSGNDTILRAAAGEGTQFVLENVYKNAEKYGVKDAFLKRAYYIRVNDANKLNNNYKYVTVSDVDGTELLVVSNKENRRPFYLKEMNHVDGTHYYALVTTDGNFKAGVIDASGLIKAENVMDETRTSAFALNFDKTAYYRLFTADELGENGVLNFFRTNTTEKAYLYEKDGLLEVENKGDNVAELADLTVLPAVTEGTIMPQYFIAKNVTKVEADTILCTEDHASIEEALACDHTKFTKDTVFGDFMVNFKVDADLDKANMWENKYSRLGFLNGYITEGKLFVNNGKKMIEATKVAENAHNAAKFSFRLVDEGEEQNFLIESESWGKNTEFDGGLRPFENGGWIKIQNTVPVIVKQKFEDAVASADLFNVDTNAGDATANEGIATSEVVVIAGEGNVTIAGAAGKKVVISNILGQVVANTVVASDNATIAAPAGVVVVAVEGEAAVKAIVK